MRRLVWALLPILNCCTGLTYGFTVIDDSGRRVSIPAPPQRIVSLAPHVTEMLYAVNAGPQLVGASAFSDYPPDARSLPRVASAGTIDYERLVALEPDLVVAWLSGNGPQAIARLEGLGVKVLAVESRDIAAIPRALRTLGRVTGHSQQGERVAERFEAQITELRRQFHGRRTVSVFYQINHRPLMTLNGQHIVSDVIRLCGGANVFADITQLVPTVTTEEVIRRNADIVIISSEIPNLEEVTAGWIAFRGLEAARTGQVVAIDADLINRQTPRLVAGARILCRLLDRARR